VAFCRTVAGSRLVHLRRRHPEPLVAPRRRFVHSVSFSLSHSVALAIPLALECMMGRRTQ
jgi:hypothetical protein